jgi:hypothetical protein
MNELRLIANPHPKSTPHAWYDWDELIIIAQSDKTGDFIVDSIINGQTYRRIMDSSSLISLVFDRHLSHNLVYYIINHFEYPELQNQNIRHAWIYDNITLVYNPKKDVIEGSFCSDRVAIKKDLNIPVDVQLIDVLHG